MRYLLIVLGLFVSFFGNAQSQGVTNAQTKLRPNQLRWSPTDATLDSVYIIRADTATGEPGWYLVTLGGSGGGVADTTLSGDVIGGLNSTFVRKINGVTVENKTPQNREVLTYNGTQWTPDSIDLADLPTLAQSVLLGRGSASTGVPQAISLGTGLSMSGTTLSNSAPDQTVTISGATGTYPNFTVTPTSPAGSSMQVQYNNAGSFGALDSFTVSANPDRVGIGVPTPTARLDIQGSGATSATNALRVRNSAGTNLLTVRNDGYLGIGTNTPLSTLDILGGNTVDGLRVHLTGQVPYIAQFYNDAYSSTTSVFQYFAFNSGNFAMGSPSNKAVSIYTSASGAGYSAPEISLTGDGNLKLLSGTGKLGVNINPTAWVHVGNATTASTPSMLLSGSGYSGGTSTTTKPTFLIEPTGTTSTGWSTSGTKLGVNAESGFTGRYLDIQLAGVSKFNVQGDKINMSTSKTPSSSTDTGTTGDICWDSNYIYVCVATNTWKRTAITTW